ncbi:minor capsid protein [Evansella tamaricis]|uniref:Minor capsid protein n=1 Tax=Evansella tamaricis TaxID=2069301 RepID=A0ABS6JL76_9BACI|nr:minor capsid protein [Evansella tamaricis]MBU9714418.1 minor capsid protein [Evansella tamaricis]
MLLDQIAKYIDDNIPSLTEGNNLWKNHYPDAPDTIVSVIHSGGYPPSQYSPTRELTFEIKIRSMDYNDGVEYGNQIMDIFHDKENYRLGNFFILGSNAYSELSYLYQDDNRRDQFSLELAFLIKK